MGIIADKNLQLFYQIITIKTLALVDAEAKVCAALVDIAMVVKARGFLFSCYSGRDRRTRSQI